MILILTIPAVLAVGIHGILRVRRDEADLVREDLRNLELMAWAVRLAVENAIRDGQLADVRRLVDDMVQHQQLLDRIQIVDRDLNPIVIANLRATAASTPASDLREVIRTGTSRVTYQRGRPSFIAYLAPLSGRDGRVDGALELVRLASAVDRQRTAAAVDVVGRLSLLLLVIVVTTIVVMQRQVLRPLARLTQAIERLGRGPSSEPLPVDRRDELGRVAQAFNAMTTRLDAAQRKVLEETERAVELERQLRQSATLAVAGRLASALAHEVGTPLNIVSGRAEVVLKSLSADTPARKDLEIIIAQIERIARTFGSVLDMVRPHRPELRPTALSGILHELLPLLSYTARVRGVELVAAPAIDIPDVLADSAQIQQVLINLVLNGVEATAAGGQVVVSIEDAKHEGRPGVALAVSDTGSGIAPEHVARLFEPFFTTKPRGQGTGLGLPICRDIVTAHGGTIDVETRLGAGTTVTVWLPEPEEAET